MDEDELIKEAFDNIPLVSTIFITKHADITDRVENILEEKGWSMEKLATEMGMTRIKLEDWFYNLAHINITLRDISKLESVLGDTIINVVK
jgi:ribosome-binding protein aMBF1 (putative translation factor)